MLQQLLRAIAVSSRHQMSKQEASGLMERLAAQGQGTRRMRGVGRPSIRRPCIHWLHVSQQARGATARSPVKSYAASAKSLAPPDAQQMLCM